MGWVAVGSQGGAEILKTAVLTSGGDAPGMNAAVRAVARTAFARNWEAVGIEIGYRACWRAVSIPWVTARWGASFNGAERCWGQPVRRSLRPPKGKNTRSGSWRKPEWKVWS